MDPSLRWGDALKTAPNSVWLNSITAVRFPRRAPLNVRSKFGGAGRDRTDDLKLAKLPLSQLSYGPDVRRQITDIRSFTLSSVVCLLSSESGGPE